ncbi:hypothetical protein ACH4SK_38720 [Streptomyces inhibens]|uniref:hypothetical protein n=1 Tax=Streptomyces inhibens TaxID=2293571 RepID=UPI0037A6ED65
MTDGLAAVEKWMVRHAPVLPAPPGRTGREKTMTEAKRPARGRYRRLSLHAPHADPAMDADSTFADRSCLPWRLGDLMTTQLQPAPRGWYLGGRA